MVEDTIAQKEVPMKHEQQVVIKRWVPILEEYERTKTKQTPRVFKSLKILCEAHHISTKELRRYYRRWIESKKDPVRLSVRHKRTALKKRLAFQSGLPAT